MRVFILSIFALTLSCNAAVVYNNGAPNGDNGNEMTGWLEAEDFQIAEDTHVTGVRFWTMESESSAFFGSFFWSILSAIDGSPGATLASGLSTSTRTPQGALLCCDGYGRVQNDIGVNFNAQAGTTYWLSLHNGPLSNNSFFGDVYWETTNPNGSSSGASQFLLFPGWYSNDQEHAFGLSSDASVPEPGTWALLSSGIAAVCMFRRRAA